MKQTYPVILVPSEGSELIMPSDTQQQSKKKKHGQSELIAFARFFKYGCGEIREDACVKICGHSYEPDFAYVNKEKGVYIDIEVDEPYATSGHPTHFLMDDGTNKDAVRNKRFQDAGWYVIRFSEEQVFCHTKECLHEVYKLALGAGAIDKMPEDLRGVSDLSPQLRWTKDDAYRMKRCNYRKAYLGYDPMRMGILGYIRCTLLLLPIAWQSISHERVRKEMCSQLRRFFSL